MISYWLILHTESGESTKQLVSYYDPAFQKIHCSGKYIGRFFAAGLEDVHPALALVPDNV